MKNRTLVNLYSSGTVSNAAFMFDRQTLPSVYHELEVLADAQLANFSVYRSSYVELRRKRYAQAAELLKEWATESGDYDQRTWNLIEPELAKSRTKMRKP